MRTMLWIWVIRSWGIVPPAPSRIHVLYHWVFGNHGTIVLTGGIDMEDTRSEKLEIVKLYYQDYEYRHDRL